MCVCVCVCDICFNTKCLFVIMVICNFIYMLLYNTDVDSCHLIG